MWEISTSTQYSRSKKSGVEEDWQEFKMKFKFINGPTFPKRPRYSEISIMQTHGKVATCLRLTENPVTEYL